MSSGRGRKRTGNGSSGNSPRGMQQVHRQVRQGSSFWTCPACGTAVHTALTSFHLSLCPVLADSTSAPALKEKNSLPRQLSGQSPEFVSGSTRKRGIGLKKSPWEDEDENEDDGGDVFEEEQLRDGSYSSPLLKEASDMGKKLCFIPGTPNPTTPIQEVGEPWVACLVESPKSDQTANARKRLFEDWGQRLSPEPEANLVIHLSPINAAAATPVTLNPQTQRSKVMTSTLDGRDPVVVGVVESPQRHQTETIFEDSGQELSPEPELGLGMHRFGINAAAVSTPFSVDPQTQRSEVINPSLHGGAPMVVGLKKSPKRDHATATSERLFEVDGTKNSSGSLDDESPSPLPCSTTAAALLTHNTPGKALVKPAGEHEESDGVGGDERCNRDTMGNQPTKGTPGGGLKTPEKGSISELLDSFPPTQGIETHVGIDPFNDHFREVTLNPQTQRSKVMTSTLDGRDPVVVDFVESPQRHQTAAARKRLFEDWGQKLSPELELDLGVHLSPINAAAAATPFFLDSQTQRSEVINPSLHGGAPTVVGRNKSPKCDHGTAKSERLFEVDGTKNNSGILDDESPSSLHCSTTAAALLTHNTPGEALVKPAVEHEESDGVGGDERCNLDTTGNQPTEGTPGGGLKTPEKGSISELLDSVPPAQGIDNHVGIDPFNDHFPETMNTDTSNRSRKIDPIPMQEDGETFVSAGDPGKFLLDNDRLNESKTSALPQASENSQEEIGPRKKRRKPALVIDSDSEEDIRDKNYAPGVGDSGKIIEDGTLSVTEIYNLDSGVGRQVSNPGADSHPYPVMAVSTEDRSLEQRIPSSPPINVLFGSEGEDDAFGNLAAGRMADKSCSSSTPDPIIEILRKDNRSLEQRIPSSPPINVLFGSEGEEDALGNLAAGSRMADKSCSSSTLDPIIEILRKDNRSLEQRISSSPPINVLFGSEGEEDALGNLAAGSRMADKSCSSSTPDPIIEILRKDRVLFSPPSVNVVLSSDEEKDFCGSGKKVKRKVNVVLSSDDEEDICESSGGSGKKGKRRRLVKVQESSDGTKTLQPDPNSEETKEIGIDKLRRSERLRNVYTSGSTQTALLSKQDGEGDSDERRSEDLATSGQRSSSKAHVLDNDNDPMEIDSDSSDGRPTGALHKIRKVIATQNHRHSGAWTGYFGTKQDADTDDEDGDGDGHLGTDESDFINDDPESDGDPHSSSSVDETSESGKESENEDSSTSESSSEGRKKYNWDLEGDMLAALAKDKELCLRGLCAIYRRQEEDEKMSASSKYQNKRGFSTFHTPRASRIARFLMGDSTSGPMVKTVKELKVGHPEHAVTYCRDMCIHYSKQLFEIYQNEEDPYFPEPYTGPEM